MKNFLNIAVVKGIDKYIFVDKKGHIEACTTENPEKEAKIILKLGQVFYSIGKNQFKHAFFSRKNGNNFFVFPVGNHYLGVIKQESIDDITLINNIRTFINKLGSESSVL